MEHRVPKTIHFVWVGKNPLPKLVLRCIESWKKHLPEYELKIWNEENIPMNHPYVEAMYSKRKWAFVSDYIRFWVLEREGGIYLDADMEVLQSLDSLLDSSMFVGESRDGYVACGIIGSVPGHPAMRAMLDFYDNDRSFSVEYTSPKVMTTVLKEGGYSNVQIYTPDYFYPCNDGEPCTAEMLEHAFTTHHWAESWVPFAPVRKLLRRLGIMPLIKRFLRKSI